MANGFIDEDKKDNSISAGQVVNRFLPKFLSLSRFVSRLSGKK